MWALFVWFLFSVWTPLVCVLFFFVWLPCFMLTPTRQVMPHIGRFVVGGNRASPLLHLCDPSLLSAIHSLWLQRLAAGAISLHPLCLAASPHLTPADKRTPASSSHSSTTSSALNLAAASSMGDTGRRPTTSGGGRLGSVSLAGFRARARSTGGAHVSPAVTRAHALRTEAGDGALSSSSLTTEAVLQRDLWR